MELQKRRNSALRALSRKGFTLPEILMAVLVFTMIFMGLGGIWATSHRYMFRAFRTQIIRNNISIAVRQIQTDLSLATRFDSTGGTAVPEYGADAQRLFGDMLVGAINVDNNYDATATPPGNKPGCYPLNADVNANKPSWFVYCFAKAKDADGNDQLNLYRYTGDVSGTGDGCPGTDPNKRWAFSSVGGLQCGKPFGGKELSVLMSGLTDGAFLKFTNRNDVIALHLKIDRPADAGERPISVTVDTDMKMNMVPFE